LAQKAKSMTTTKHPSVVKPSKSIAPVQSSETADEGEKGLGFERIVFFSDAVFAIAITLLALEIQVGEIADARVNVELPQRLLELWPQLLGFLLGFFVIGSYWVAHHMIFGYIQRYDRRLITLNMLFLALIALSPFPNNVIGEYGLHQPAQIFYALSMSVTGFTRALLWGYASYNHRLIDPALDQRMIRQIHWRGLVVPVAFLLSIPFTWMNPVVPIVIWVVAPSISVMLSRWL
jgi:uncharacterized membrane protein